MQTRQVTGTDGEQYQLCDCVDCRKQETEQSDFMATRCEQCGKVMGAEIFLGPVCGKCCRENHRRVMGR